MILIVEYHGLDWIFFRNWSGKGPDWELRSGFSLDIGPEKVRICFKKWSGIGPILENIGPIQDLGALLQTMITISKQAWQLC